MSAIREPPSGSATVISSHSNNCNCTTPIQQRSQCGAARSAEGVQNQISWLSVVANVLTDSVMRLFRCVCVHVVNGRSFGRRKRLVVGSSFIAIRLQIVGLR